MSPGNARLVLTLAWLAAGASARAEIPNELEPDYADASLAYNAKDYARAVKRVDEVLARSPENARIPEFLELKALSLKAARRDKESVEIYELLIRSRTEAGRPAREIAPYHFELGMIRDRQKQVDEAKAHFAFAAEEGFNEGPANFYLGGYAYRAGQWDEAGDRFRDVAASDSTDLKPPAYFYLGQIALRSEDGPGATRSFLAARNRSREVLSDERSAPEAKSIAGQVREATEKVLEPFDRSTFFAHLNFMSGYDSNPLLNPSTTDPTFAASGAGTPRQTLAAGVGYSTSPLKFVQLVPGYRGALNLNLNEDARSTEFFSHLASLYVTFAPLARLSYGIKGEGDLVFRNPGGEDSPRFAFERFYSTVTIGPYLKYELKPRLMLGFSIDVSGRQFAGEDPDSGNAFRRSGSGFLGRVSLQSQSGSRFFNPSGALRAGSNSTDGSEFDSKFQGLELSNVIRLLPKLEITGTFDLVRSNFNHRSAGDRDDLYFGLRAFGSYRHDERWTWLASVDGAINSSTAPQFSGPDDLFAYKRLMMNVGASYSF